MNTMSNESVPQGEITASTTVEWSHLECEMVEAIKDVDGIRRCAEALRVSAQDMEDLANKIGNSPARIWTEGGTIFVSASAELIRRLVAEGLLFFPNDDPEGTPLSPSEDILCDDQFIDGQTIPPRSGDKCAADLSPAKDSNVGWPLFVGSSEHRLAALLGRLQKESVVRVSLEDAGCVKTECAESVSPSLIGGGGTDLTECGSNQGEQYQGDDLILAILEDYEMAAAVILNGTTVFHEDDDKGYHQEFDTHQLVERLAYALNCSYTAVLLTKKEAGGWVWNFDDIEEAALRRVAAWRLRSSTKSPT